MRPALAFSFVRDGRLWRVIYVILGTILFGFGIAHRFSLPLIPILDADSPNFLWTALSMIHFPAALLAELCAVRYLLGFVVRGEPRPARDLPS
ncbi:MAG: hypothetical protein ACJ8NS_05940 [Chthoniobacterales bacterium]